MLFLSLTWNQLFSKEAWVYFNEMLFRNQNLGTGAFIVFFLLGPFLQDPKGAAEPRIMSEHTGRPQPYHPEHTLSRLSTLL